MEVPGKSRTRDLEEADAVLCPPLCQPCQERNLSTLSNGLCTQCQEHMCVTCFNTHKQFKLTKGHSFSDRNSASVNVEQNEDLQKCDQHFNELVKFYCPVHEQVGCGDCMILEHKVCKVEYIRDKAREFADSLEFKGLVNDADKCLSQCKETATSIKNNKVQVSDISEKFIRDVEMFSEGLISQINKMKTSMIKQANIVKSKDLDTLEKLEKENEVLMEDISSLMELLKSQTDLPIKLFVSYVKERSRLKQLQETHSKIEKQNLLKNYQFNGNCNLEQAFKETRELGSLQEIKIENDNADDREAQSLVQDFQTQARIAPLLSMQKNKEPLLPYKLLCRNIKVDGEYLSYVDNGKRNIGLFVFKNTRKVEIEIIDTKPGGAIAVGCVQEDYPENCQPGWVLGSIGYHSDDGKLFNGRGSGEKFGPKCYVGDRMGCVLNSFLFNDSVVFSRNGQQVGERKVPRIFFQIYPAIGLLSPGDKIKVIMESLDA